MKQDGTGLETFEVLCNEQVAEDIWRMECRTRIAEQISAGQFVNVSVPGDSSHILRVPLSFSGASGDRLVLEYAVVGEGTRRLSRMCVGETSTLVGPCGVGWRVPQGEGRALLVAGGIGLPPIVACARMLAQLNVGFDAVVGAQTAARHLRDDIEVLRSLPPVTGCDCERKVVLTTDDGTLGVEGFTTEVMRSLVGERGYVQVYACGPEPMLAAVARLADESDMACQVSLERMMGCGFGACSCCNVALRRGGYALCCQDGPVFDAREVAW